MPTSSGVIGAILRSAFIEAALFLCLGSVLSYSPTRSSYSICSSSFFSPLAWLSSREWISLYTFNFIGSKSSESSSREVALRKSSNCHFSLNFLFQMYFLLIISSSTVRVAYLLLGSRSHWRSVRPAHSWRSQACFWRNSWIYSIYSTIWRIFWIS